MFSTLPKYIKKNSSFLIFSNCSNYCEIFRKVFSESEEPDEIGFVKPCLHSSNYVGLEFLQQDQQITGFENFKNTSYDSNLSCSLIMSNLNSLKYITSSSKFIIFSNNFSHKEIANYLFSDYFIQSAGTINLSIQNNKVIVNCLPTDTELDVSVNELDSQMFFETFEFEKYFKNF